MNASEAFAYDLSGVFYRHAAKDKMITFYDQWEPAPGWLAENTSLDRRMEIVFDDNPLAEIAGFINTSLDGDALEEVISEMPEITAMDYALKVIANFPDAGPMLNYAVGVASDTITPAEHHIYGSSLLAILSLMIRAVLSL